MTTTNLEKELSIEFKELFKDTFSPFKFAGKIIGYPEIERFMDSFKESLDSIKN